MSAPIQAERVVAASPEAVFTFLCDFENHWKLTGRWVKAVAIEDSNGNVRIYGPLRILQRTARTKLVEIEPSHALHGTAELSGGTFAHIAWDLTEDAGGTGVRPVGGSRAIGAPRPAAAVARRPPLVDAPLRRDLGTARRAVQLALSQTRATPVARRVHCSTDAKSTFSGVSVG